jgi:hypothetical protein
MQMGIQYWLFADSLSWIPDASGMTNGERQLSALSSCGEYLTADTRFTA